MNHAACTLQSFKEVLQNHIHDNVHTIDAKGLIKLRIINYFCLLLLVVSPQSQC